MKAKKYNQSTIEYQKLLNLFMSKFDNYFGEGSTQKYDIEALFLENLKAIKKYPGISFKKFPYGFLSGLYISATKTLEYTEEDEATIIHELFHALTHKAFKKRESFFKFILSLCNKKFDVRAFEEGMTEYFACCLMGEHYKNYRFSYAQETNIIYKLAKIYGDIVVLEYFLGLNDNLSRLINNTEESSFSRILLLTSYVGTNEEVLNAFEFPCYYKENKKVSDDLLFRLFSKKILRKVETVDDFAFNMKSLFSYYESDIYKVVVDISSEEEREEKDTNKNHVAMYQNAITNHAQNFRVFYQILRTEWNKLGINDDEMFNNLVLRQIEELDEYTSSLILDYLEYWSEDLRIAYQKKTNPVLVAKESNVNYVAVPLEENISFNLTEEESISPKR